MVALKSLWNSTIVSGPGLKGCSCRIKQWNSKLDCYFSLGRVKSILVFNSKRLRTWHLVYFRRVCSSNLLITQLDGAALRRPLWQLYETQFESRWVTEVVEVKIVQKSLWSLGQDKSASFNFQKQFSANTFISFDQSRLQVCEWFSQSGISSNN